MTKFRLLAACAAVWLGTGVAPAQQQRPTIVLKIQPIDEILKNVEYIAGLVDQREMALQGLGVIDAMKGAKGIEGIDTARPMGLYVKVTPGALDSAVVGLIPVADRDAFLNFLARFGVEPEESKDGTYSVEMPDLPVPIYLRFEQKYACVTVLSKDGIDPKNLPDLAKVLELEDANLISFSAHIDAIPNEAIDLLVGQIEMGAADAQAEGDPDETPAQQEFRLAFTDSLVGGVKMLFTQGGEIRAGLAVDPKSDEIRLEFDLGSRPGTDLADRFAALGSKRGTIVPGLMRLANVAGVGVNFELPAAVKRRLGPVVDDAFREAADQAAVDAPIDVRLVEGLLEAVEPTAKSGVFEGGMVLHRPAGGGKFILVSGNNLKDGAKVEASVKKLVADLPGEIRQLVKFDVAKVGASSLHKITLPPDAAQDEKFRDTFGEDAEVWLATAEDRVFLAMGQNPEAAVRSVATQVEGPTPLFVGQLAFRELAPLMEEDNPGASKVAAEVFADMPEGGDTIRLTVDGGERIEFRLAFKGRIIRFAMKLEQSEDRIDDD